MYNQRSLYSYFLFTIISILAISFAYPFIPSAAHPAASPEVSLTFTVDSNADTLDGNPGDGVCLDSSGHCTLRTAVMEANAHAGADIINLSNFDPVLTRSGAGENNALTGDLDIKDALTIAGYGHLEAIINANQLDRAFQIMSGVAVTITQVSIGNGKIPDNPADGLPWGGGIYNQGNLTLQSCYINSNVSRTGAATGLGYYDGGDGGAILNDGNLIVASGTAIDQNHAGDGMDNNAGAGGNGGGIASYSGAVIIRDSSITNNTAGAGGDAYAGGAGAGGYGGKGAGIYISGGTLLIERSIIQGNLAGAGGASGGGTGTGGGGGSGAGIYSLVSTTINSSTIQSNQTGAGGSGNNYSHFGQGGVGGGIYIYGQPLSLSSATINNNLTGAGGLGSGGQPGGMGGDGGGILCSWSLIQADNLTLTNNHTGNGSPGGNNGGAGGEGGGLYADTCNLNLNGGLIQGNYTGSGGNGSANGGDGGSGGGLRMINTSTLTNVTVSGNWTGNGGSGATLAGNGGLGGGISKTGELNLIRCTVSSNHTGNAGSGPNGNGGHGGGIQNYSGYTNITNSTISGNSTGTGFTNGNGGGIYGSAELVSSTVVYNTTSGQGGGVYGVDTWNTIIANNSSALGSHDCYVIGFYVYNLLGNTSGCYIYDYFPTLNITNKNPQLGLLANNGGTTQTHALLSNSPAIDSGDPATPGSSGYACPVTDQRGHPRSDLSCDIGAFESTFGGSGGSATIIKPLSSAGESASFGPTLVTVTLTSSNPITLTVTKIASPPPTWPSSLPASWMITATLPTTQAPTPPNYVINLGLCYTDAEALGHEENLIDMYRWDGNSWIKQDATPNPVQNCVIKTGVTELSGWMLATPPKLFLPLIHKP